MVPANYHTVAPVVKYILSMPSPFSPLSSVLPPAHSPLPTPREKAFGVAYLRDKTRRGPVPACSICRFLCGSTFSPLLSSPLFFLDSPFPLNLMQVLGRAKKRDGSITTPVTVRICPKYHRLVSLQECKCSGACTFGEAATSSDHQGARHRRQHFPTAPPLKPLCLSLSDHSDARCRLTLSCLSQSLTLSATSSASSSLPVDRCRPHFSSVAASFQRSPTLAWLAAITTSGSVAHCQTPLVPLFSATVLDQASTGSLG